MERIKIKHISQLKHYTGAHAIDGIRFKTARHQLGVKAWGMNVLELDAGVTTYPEHDHREDGQEEVYLVLEGSLRLLAEGEERVVSRGEFIYVPADVVRKFETLDDGATLLALGGTPGKAYAGVPIE